MLEGSDRDTRSVEYETRHGRRALALTLTGVPHLAAQTTNDGITALTYDVELDSRFLPLSSTVTPDDAG